MEARCRCDITIESYDQTTGVMKKKQHFKDACVKFYPSSSLPPPLTKTPSSYSSSSSSSSFSYSKGSKAAVHIPATPVPPIISPGGGNVVIEVMDPSSRSNYYVSSMIRTLTLPLLPLQFSLSFALVREGKMSIRSSSCTSHHTGITSSILLMLHNAKPIELQLLCQCIRESREATKEEIMKVRKAIEQQQKEEDDDDDDEGGGNRKKNNSVTAKYNFLHRNQESDSDKGSKEDTSDDSDDPSKYNLLAAGRRKGREKKKNYTNNNSAASKGNRHVSSSSSSSSSTSMFTEEQLEVINAVMKGKNVFFTGSAGTGKSLVLQELRRLLLTSSSTSTRNKAVLGSNNNSIATTVAFTASTGVAATAIEGTTLHAWSGVGMNMFQAYLTQIQQQQQQQSTTSTSITTTTTSTSTTPTTASTVPSALTLTQILQSSAAEQLISAIQKRRDAHLRWIHTRTLIVDEISMVDGDFLDMLDIVGRKLRSNLHLPFGGLQVVFSGDFFQLPPVQSGSGSGHSNNKKKFAFQSRVWSSATSAIHTCIELTRVFRQESDEQFASILDELRWGRVSETAAAILRSRWNAPLNLPHLLDQGIKPTILHTHRANVDAENKEQLQALPGECVVHKCVDSFNNIDLGRGSNSNNNGGGGGGGGGNSSSSSSSTLITMLNSLLESICPAPKELTLKLHAQVILTKTLDASQGLVNGARGVVVSFSGVGKYPLVRFASHKAGGGEGGGGGVKQEVVIRPETWTVSPAGNNNAGGGGSVIIGPSASRRQLPLDLAWSLSIHKSQGMTLDAVEMSLSRVFEYGQAYVSLSRVRSLQGLVLCEKFSPSCVRAHPDVVSFYTQLRTQSINGVEVIRNIGSKSISSSSSSSSSSEIHKPLHQSNNNKKANDDDKSVSSFGQIPFAQVPPLPVKLLPASIRNVDYELEDLLLQEEEEDERKRSNAAAATTATTTATATIVDANSHSVSESVAIRTKEGAASSSALDSVDIAPIRRNSDTMIEMSKLIKNGKMTVSAFFGGAGGKKKVEPSGTNTHVDGASSGGADTAATSTSSIVASSSLPAASAVAVAVRRSRAEALGGSSTSARKDGEDDDSTPIIIPVFCYSSSSFSLENLPPSRRTSPSSYSSCSISPNKSKPATSPSSKGKTPPHRSSSSVEGSPTNALLSSPPWKRNNKI